MRVFLINYMETTSAGGINKTVMEIAKNLSKMGHKVTVLQANPFNLPDEEIYEGFKIIRVKSRFGDIFYGFHPEMYFYIKRHFKELNPDIIHVHGYHTLFSPEIVYFIRRVNQKIPLVFSPHFGNYSHNTLAGKYLWRPYNMLIGRKIMEYSNIIISASNFEANEIHKILNINENKIFVIPHGVDVIDLGKVKRKHDTINLLYAGYLLKLKGVNYVIEALHELIYKKGAKVQLTIAGKGPYEDQLKKFAEVLNVNEFINWRGFIISEELQNEIKKADILLLLTKSENFGIVVSEALALGTPVIVTNRTALKEFLNEPGCFGVDYPPDPFEVADLILKIYESNINVGPFSDKIRIWDEVAKDYEKLYQEILNHI